MTDPAAQTKTPAWVRDGPRPSWRGRLHQAAAFAVVPVSLPLVLGADGRSARVGATVFALALLALFATSATYHLGEWSGPWTLRMKRADHIAIFVLIAGTYTGVGLQILDGWLLAGVIGGAWLAVLGGAVAALLGVFEKRGAANASYITLGWLALLMAPRMLDRLTVAELALVIAGGVIYTVGAVFLAMQRPNPWPDTFGYHEIWHACTLLAAACHFATVWSLTR